MRIVAGPKYAKTCGFHTDTQCNKVVYIMIADHLVLLYSNNLIFSETYFCVCMQDQLYDWSFVHNHAFYNKVFQHMANDEARHWNMPNTKFIRNKLRNLP